MSKLKSFHEAIELSFMKVGRFFMLVMFPFIAIICHVVFDCLWNISSIYIGCLVFQGILTIFAILSFDLCEVFGHECCVVCNFCKEKGECIMGIFRFLNFFSLPPNVSWYFDWCLLTCAQQSNDLCVSPLVCMCLLPSLLFYMCVYGYVHYFT